MSSFVRLRLGRCNTRELRCSNNGNSSFIILEAGKDKMELPADGKLAQDSLAVFLMAAFLLCSDRGRRKGRERENCSLVFPSLPIKGSYGLQCFLKDHSFKHYSISGYGFSR